METKLWRWMLAAMVAVTAAVLLAASARSLGWRYQHDSPLMIYDAWLMSKGWVPYRDFYDFNVPGTYFVMWAMGAAGGWSELGFRLGDLLCLASISGATYLWLRRLGPLPAVSAAVLFPLWYLHVGPALSLQREYLGLVPFTWILAITGLEVRLRDRRSAVLVGLLAGLTVTIKPQFLLLAVPCLVLLAGDRTEPVGRRARLSAMAAGLALPPCAMLLYLVTHGALRPFLSIAVNDWPLYMHLTGQHEPIHGLPRLIYMLRQTPRWLWTPLFPLAICGVVRLHLTQRMPRAVWAIGGLLAASIAYPSLSGQFFAYHWLPYRHALFVCGSLCLVDMPQVQPRRAVLLAQVLAMALMVHAPHSHLLVGWLRTAGAGAPKGGVPDAIGQYLREHSQPGDTVQPLDWTGGAVHGMMLARRFLGTRFMYDFQFYHHLSAPYTQRLRREFIAEFTAKKPDFVVQIIRDKPWPVGPDTTQEFPELSRLLATRYVPVQSTPDYVIYQRVRLPGG